MPACANQQFFSDFDKIYYLIYLTYLPKSLQEGERSRIPKSEVRVKMDNGHNKDGTHMMAAILVYLLELHNNSRLEFDSDISRTADEIYDPWDVPPEEEVCKIPWNQRRPRCCYYQIKFGILIAVNES